MADVLVKAFDSCWADQASGQFYDQLQGSLHAEVVVVGGGIVGLTTALMLAEEGRDVVLVEALRVGRGVSGGSTAKITTQHGLLYAQLVAERGPEIARSYVEANRAGIARIQNWIEQYSIDCDFEAKASYLYSSAPADTDRFVPEKEAAQRLGLPMELLERAPLPFETVVALRLADQAQFNPVRYLDGLAAGLSAKGGRIFEHSRVRQVEEASRWQVMTDGGNVHAEHVVVATNLTIKSPVGMAGRTRPRMHTATAFRADRDLIDGMFLGIDHPRHSLRMGRDGQGALLVVLGPKFDTGRDRDVAARFGDLESWVRQHFEVGDAIWRWCNEDYDTPDRVALAGEPDPEKAAGYHIATGFNAWGISNGTAVGMLIADTIVRGASPWAAVYDPIRPAPRSFNKGGDSASIVTSVAMIERGEGGIVQRGGKPVAIWKSGEGRVHEVSAACTHKGCTVTWNNAAKTWDCPCHGSIFDPFGKVLHGPARQNLKPADGNSD